MSSTLYEEAGMVVTSCSGGKSGMKVEFWASGTRLGPQEVHALVQVLQAWVEEQSTREERRFLGKEGMKAQLVTEFSFELNPDLEIMKQTIARGYFTILDRAGVAQVRGPIRIIPLSGHGFYRPRLPIDVGTWEVPAGVRAVSVKFADGSFDCWDFRDEPICGWYQKLNELAVSI